MRLNDGPPWGSRDEHEYNRHSPVNSVFERMTRIQRQIDPSTEGPPDTSVAALTESSEAALKAGIIQTHVGRPLAWGMTILFLALIFSVPIFQALVEIHDSGRVQA